MIELTDVSKVYKARHGHRTILDHVNLSVRKSEKLGILGRNGAGKSTLIRLISGAEMPTSGTVERNMSVSWPLAFGGAFQGSLTGLDNIRFICRVYGTALAPAIRFVDEFSELGATLREPVKHYSSGMLARLAFAISLAVEFDCFLIDEIVAVGDAKFQEKCRVELFEKRKNRAIILVSHDSHYIREHCEHAAVLDAGRLISFSSVDDAFRYYDASTA
jgi:capsular polysaccharide transport system ATP-binding protein